MPEIATAWVTLTVSAKNARRDIQRELDGVNGSGAGRKAGAEFSSAASRASNFSGIEQKMLSAAQSAGRKAGDALSVGIKAGAAAGVAALGTSIKLGMDRLTAIDDAQGKLRALGHDARSTATIMDSALASVKGTAFGLGDAATISASAVAAGIKPGQDLTKYLKSTADAATIAGTSLSDMGRIFNQVQTGQTAYTDDLNQLADRGLPIYQWVAKEMKISATEVKKYAEKGKIDSKIFFDAIQRNISGAALESGKTVRGSFENTKAALGRFGAALNEPSFKRAPATFGAITRALDDATPAAGRMAKSFDAKVFDDFIPKAQKAWQELKANPEVRSSLTEVSQVFVSLGNTAQQVAPSLLQIGKSLGQATATLGVSSWQLFVTALEAAAGVVNTIAGPLQFVAELMRDHQGVVTAAAAAWLAFRTVPGLLGNLRAGMASVTTEGSKVSGAVQQVGRSLGTLQSGAGRVRDIGTAFTMYGRSFTDAVQQVKKLDPALSTTRASMATFSAFAGQAATAGLGKLKSAASGVVGALGGPWGAAFAAAGIATMAIVSQNQRSAQSFDALQSAIKKTANARNELGEALIKARGSETNADVKAAAKERIDALKQELEAAGNREGSFWDRLKPRDGKSIWSVSNDDNRFRDIEDAANKAKEAQAALDGLKMTQQSLADVTYGSRTAFDSLVSKLDAAGGGSAKLAGELRTARGEFAQQQELASRSTPGITEMAKAMQALGDKTATAADKTNALKAAIDALNPARSKGEAIAQHDKALQQVAESTQQAIDRTRGFGAALLSTDLGVSTTTANGQELRSTLLGLVDASTAAAGAGRPLTEVHEKNAAELQKLATQYGLTVEQITGAFNTLGGRDIELTARLSGAPETIQQIGQIARAMQDAKIGEKKFIPIAVDDQAKKSIEALGFTVERLPDGKGINVTANTTDAQTKLTGVLSALSTIPAEKPVNISAPGGQQVFDLLKSMGVEVATNNDKNITVASPLAPATLELLKQLGIEVTTNNDKTISVKQVGAEVAGGQIDAAAKNRSATITVFAVDSNGNDVRNNPLYGQGLGVARRANGGIVPMAAGGLRWLNQKPTTAGIYAGRGAGTIFAERETGGEAYVPLAPGKRPRSTAILSEVARLFGLQLVRPGEMFQSFADGGLRPGAAALKNIIASKFGVANIGGYRAEDGYGEHSSGRALDVMVGNDSAKGDAITQFAIANASKIGLKWVIWKQAMHYPDGRVEPMEDRGSPTQNHMDHPHIFLDQSSDKADFAGLGGDSSSGSTWNSLTGLGGSSSTGGNGDSTGSGGSGSFRAATDKELTSAGKKVTTAQSGVKQAEQSVSDKEFAVEQAKRKLAELDGKKTSESQRLAAERRVTVAERELTDSKDRLTKAQNGLSDAQSAEEKLRTQGVEDAKSKSGNDQGSQGQSFAQGMFSGFLQSVGFDGSLFSNPLEWPNVKSAIALANWGAGLAKGAGKGAGTAGGQSLGEGAASGVASGLGLNLSNVADFMKPIEPQKPITPAGPGMAIPIPQKGGDTYNISGVNPNSVKHEIDNKQNSAYRRQKASFK